MPLRVVCALIVASTLALTPNTTAAADTPSQHFTLTSPAFKDNGVLPLKYAGGAECGSGSRGGNLSPPLRWSNVPAKTKSFAIVMIDPDGRRGIGSVHWIAYDIPATRTGMKEGEGDAPRPDITGGKNSRGSTVYVGPCGPPADAPHHYVIDVIALDLASGILQPGLDRDALLKAIDGHSLGPASLVVRYHRQP
jgi:Raf kinase inhibitor-like YbhB/YbcL family protein